MIIEGIATFSSLVSDANLIGQMTANDIMISGGVNNPNALRCAFSIDIMPLADSGQGSFIRLFGIPLWLLQKGNTIAGKNVTLYGGFTPGLPLATAQSLGPRRGMIMQGLITACYGHWQGNDIALDLIVTPMTWKGQGTDSSSDSPGPEAGGNSSSSAPSRYRRRRLGVTGYTTLPSRLLSRRPPPYLGRRSLSPTPQDASISDAITSSINGDISGFMNILATSIGGGGFRQTPVNLIHNLMTGMPLQSAIQQTLITAFPNANIKMNLGAAASLKLTYQDSGFYQNMSQYAGYIKSLAQSILSGTGKGLNNEGIDIIPHGDDLIVTDWSNPSSTVSLDYTDLIGQPTWTGPNQLQFSCVLRADLYPTVNVTFPANTLFSSHLPDKSVGVAAPLIFSGSVILRTVRFVGDSRSPDGMQWRCDCTGVVNGDAGAETDAITKAADNFYTGAGTEAGRTNPQSRLQRRPVRYYV